MSQHRVGSEWSGPGLHTSLHTAMDSVDRRQGPQEYQDCPHTWTLFTCVRRVSAHQILSAGPSSSMKMMNSAQEMCTHTKLNLSLTKLVILDNWVDFLLSDTWGLSSGKRVSTSFLRWARRICKLFEHFERLLIVVVGVQIWDGHGLRNCLNLTALNQHGRVYDDGNTHSSPTNLYNAAHYRIMWAILACNCRVCMNVNFVFVCFQPSLVACHGHSARTNCSI